MLTLKRESELRVDDQFVPRGTLGKLIAREWGFRKPQLGKSIALETMGKKKPTIASGVEG